MSRAPTLHNSMRMGQLKTVRMGEADETLFKNAKVVSTDQGQHPSYTNTGYDLNGDGVADAWKFDSFDATGKLTSEQVSIQVAGKAGAAPTTFTAGDTNGDGKIDWLVRNGATDSVAVQDGDNDGKADTLSTQHFRDGKVTTSHFYSDSNHDGKLDWASDGRRASAKEQFDAVQTPARLPNLALQGKLDDVLAGAKTLSSKDGINTRTVVFDLNGDGKMDLIETDTLDANRQVQNRYFNAYTLDASGQELSDGSFGDFENDGKVDWISNATGSTVFTDTNKDGKLDSEYTTRNGKTETLMDQDSDGKPDWVYTSRTF